MLYSYPFSKYYFLLIKPHLLPSVFKINYKIFFFIFIIKKLASIYFLRTNQSNYHLFRDFFKNVLKIFFCYLTILFRNRMYANYLFNIKRITYIKE